MNSSQEIVLGLVSVASLIFAVYTYYKSREYIYPLIEKLRASRNNLIQIEKTALRIAEIADSSAFTPDEKIKQMRQLSRTISTSIHTYMNTIDDGIDWGHLSAKAIYERLK